MTDDWGFPNPATPPGSSDYYSLRFCPPARRDQLAALCGWRHQVRSVLRQVSDPGVAAAKLHWWREELGRVVAGAGNHPLSLRLAPLIRGLGLPSTPFAEQITAVEALLARRRPRDLAALSAAAEHDRGALFELMVRIGGDQDPERIERARRLGAYTSLVDQIRDSGWLLRRGYDGLVPTDRLAALGLAPEDLLTPTGRAHLPTILAGLAGEARTLRGTGTDGDDQPLPVRCRVRLQDLLLDELTASDFDLVDRRIALTPIRKLWHAWREARRRGLCT